jgi:demethylmenaquinone methyltransferase/2-methoxy-6-polyprenyl-1,4-benzoquinol methylase
MVVGDAMPSYYDARAAEYDDWWLGTGLFASRERPGWHREREALAAVVRDLEPVRTLDVACGTGFLTRLMSGQVTAIDQAERMVRIASARMPHGRVLRADAVPLPFATGEFDRVFTSHFYGHLLPGERERFLAEARRVASELVVVDSAQRPGVEPEQWQERRLNDGTEHRVYKRWFTGTGLAGELGGGEVLFEGDWFVAVLSGRAG